MRAPGVRPVVGVLTDFGLQDHYVGVMKAVIAGIAPDALVIDISHSVPPQSVLAGQRLLRASVLYFPPGSVFVAVVDPGVGTARRPMALRCGERVFVGPDNGLFTPWLSGDAVELTALEFRLPEVSPTFHGRDIFAPAAAHLARGLPLEHLGPPLRDPVRLQPPEARKLPDGTIEGEIAYVDVFGNLITNITGVTGGSVALGEHRLPVRLTYGAIASGELLALVGSEGELEIAMRDGNAARVVRAQAGEAVFWRPE